MTRSERKTALITGATGFVGSHLTRRLVKEGWKIHIITRRSSNLDALGKAQDKIEIHQYNGTTDGMIKIMKNAKPDAVFHLSSLFMANHTPKDVAPLLQSNILFGTQLVEAMVTNNIYALVNTGTSWQHYENRDYSPVCLYAATKQAFEVLLQFYVETTPLKVITLKLFDTYGPEDTRAKLFSLLRKVAEQKEPLAMSPGEQLIDLVYIDDVVDAYLVAVKCLFNGEVKSHARYPVSSGSSIKLKELVGKYEQKVGSKLPIRWGGRPYREREVMAPWDSLKRLKNWHPKVNLDEGLKRMLNKVSS